METRIKERLTGALILVAALVILVPEIFSGRHIGEPRREPPPAAPASEGPPLRSYVTEADATQPPPIESPAVATAAAPAPAGEAAPMIEPPRGTPGRDPPIAPGKPVNEPAQKPLDKPAEKTPAAPARGDWFVQVGSFSQAANAERYAQQLRQQGFTPLVLPPAGAKGLVRVRVGPVRTRESAVALLERLAANGHKGAVVGS